MTFAIGTISHATLRSDDLISAFAPVLSEMDKNETYSSLLSDATSWLEEQDDDTENHPGEQQTGSEIVNELIDALNDLAPPFTYFGNTEGDGSDFGFWPDLESLEQAARDDDDVIKVSDSSEIPTGFNGLVMLVNDHGNVTLFEPKIEYQEIWAIV